MDKLITFSEECNNYDPWGITMTYPKYRCVMEKDGDVIRYLVEQKDHMFDGWYLISEHYNKDIAFDTLNERMNKTKRYKNHNI